MGATALRHKTKAIKGLRGEVLVGLVRRFGLSKLAEIGVKSGQLTLKLATDLPGATIYAVDPWCFYADWPAWGEDTHIRHERSFDRVSAMFPGRIVKIKLP